MGKMLVKMEYENLYRALELTLQEEASICFLYEVLDTYLTLSQDHQRGQELDTFVLQRFEELSPEVRASGLGTEFLRVLGQAANRQRYLKQYAQAKQMYQELLLLLKDVTLEKKARALMQAGTLHNLGMVAQAERAWEEAKSYYQQALQIEVEYNARYEQAGTLNQLGMVAQAERAWEEARGYYQQALQIKVEYNDRYLQASTLHQLGRLAQEQRAWEEARHYYQQALQIYIEYEDMEGSGPPLLELARLWQATLEKDLLDTTASILSVAPDEVSQRFEELLQASEERDEGDEGHDSPHS